MSGADERLSKLVNASGFPLQMALEYRLRETFGASLQPFRSEFPWTNPTYEDEGYLDLLAGWNAFRVLISAKRVRDADLVFLQPRGVADRTQETRAYWRWHRPTPAHRGDWSTVHLFPETAEATYVVQGKDKAFPLEKEAATLIHALEAIAFQEDRCSPEDALLGALRVYVPVLVTTAKLHVCVIDADRIDLATGEAPPNRMITREVPAVRLTKAFTPPLGSSSARNLDELGQRLERTVFVVTAESLTEFVGSLATERAGLRQVSMRFTQPWEI